MALWTIVVATLALMETLPAVSVHAKEFRVYWNIPTFQCKPFKLPPTNVTELYGILQNVGDSFRGNQISILYDPGLFPALLANASSPTLFRRNGGVPQAGNLDAHLQLFAQHLDELIPDRSNAGVAIIDFESWRPVYRQNFGKLDAYKTLSVQLQRDQHPFWPRARAEAAAKAAFEASGRRFMLDTLRLAQQLRPLAQWGYYGLPMCFNNAANAEQCASNIRLENDSTQWLFDASQAIYPSVYMNEQSVANGRRMVRGRVVEAQRVARAGQPVLVYHRYVLTDSRRYLTADETLGAFQAMWNRGASGAILWGASRDLNSRSKCETFYRYLAEVLGPVVRQFTNERRTTRVPPSADDDLHDSTGDSQTI